MNIKETSSSDQAWQEDHVQGSPPTLQQREAFGESQIKAADFKEADICQQSWNCYYSVVISSGRCTAITLNKPEVPELWPESWTITACFWAHNLQLHT